jgi:hypothetical protein
LRRSNATPLPSLYDVHPEARGASSHELGLQTIPVAEIAGTAVEGPDQRGSDFLPPPALRSRDWAARWQRLRTAAEQLEVLPPIDVIRAAGTYWVVDGHNRVAAALAQGQLEIDALVRGIRLPGEPPQTPGGSLAAMLEGGDRLRAAGQGRLSPGAQLERPSNPRTVTTADERTDPTSDPEAQPISEPDPRSAP